MKYKVISDAYVRYVCTHRIDILGFVRYFIEAVFLHIFLYRFKQFQKMEDSSRHIRLIFYELCADRSDDEFTLSHLCLVIYIEHKYSSKQQRSCIKTCDHQTYGRKCLNYCPWSSQISQILWRSKCAYFVNGRKENVISINILLG